MTEYLTALSKPLVVGHKRDGRAQYDEEAKRELIEAGMQPGVSIARLALQHGVNANLLRTWIAKRRREVAPGELSTVTRRRGRNSKFIPVQVRTSPKVRVGSLTIELANGIRVRLADVGRDELGAILEQLSTLPCSVSTHG